MEINFKEHKVMLDQPSTVQVVDQIKRILQGNYYFSHFVADETVIYENHEQYLEQYLPDIHKLEIVAKTVKEFVNDLLLSTQEYTERAIVELQPLAEAFYSNPTSETWSTLDQLLGGLQWIHDMLMTVGTSGKVPSNWSRYIEVSYKMQEEIRDLAEAMENEDNVLIGDLLHYELLPNFEKLQKETKWTIDNEGMRYDLN